jgi:hypothetical protein
MGTMKIWDGTTWQLVAQNGPAGPVVLPVGGSTGQVLAKQSGSDFDTAWRHDGVATFPTAAARTAAIPVPVLNQLTMLDTDPGHVQYWTGSSWAWIDPAAGWAVYNPTWQTTNQPPILGNGSVSGRYARMGNVVFVRIGLSIGSTSSSGTGNFAFSLPFPASPVAIAQEFVAVGFTAVNGLVWLGFAQVGPSGNNVNPYFPINTAQSNLTNARSSAEPAQVGTGIPGIVGQFTWGSGSNMTIQGWYEVT